MFDSTSIHHNRFANTTANLGSKHISLLEVYSNLSIEMDRLELASKGSKFTDPRQAKAVEIVMRGLKYAGDYLGTPVYWDLIKDSDARDILDEAKKEEQKMRAQNHPFPRAFGLVQGIAHVLGEMKVAAETNVTAANEKIRAAAHTPDRRWVGVKEAQAEREVAIKIVKPLQMVADYAGHIVRDYKAVCGHFPESMREPAPQYNAVALLAASLGRTVPAPRALEYAGH